MSSVPSLDSMLTNPAIMQLLTQGSSLSALGMANASGSTDPTSSFLQLLEQEMGNNISSTSNQTSATSALTNTTNVSDALLLVSQLMQGLPVPGAASSSDSALNFTNADSTTSSDSLLPLLSGISGNTSLDSSTSTNDLLSLLSDIPGLSQNVSASPSNTLNPYQTSPTSSTQTSTPADVNQAISQSAAKYDVPASLIRGVIQQESGMNSNAVSSAGAMGLMQLMPQTAKALGVTNPFDPIQNIDAGTRYLSQLISRFSGNIANALAAYNAGPQAVISHGGIPPYPETQHYVQNVLALSQKYASSAF